MDLRLSLQSILETILGSEFVYFQPPATKKKLTYPCIVFKRTNVDTLFADNNPYVSRKQYQIIVIDANPDSLIPDKIGLLPTASFDRFYTADNLNHDVYNLYY